MAAWRDLREGRGFSEAIRRGERWAIAEVVESLPYYSTLLEVLRAKEMPTLAR